MAGATSLGRFGRRSCVCCLPRRDVLAGFAAVAAGAALPAAPACSASPRDQGRPHRRAPAFCSPRLHRRSEAHLAQRPLDNSEADRGDGPGRRCAVGDLHQRAGPRTSPISAAARKFSRMANEFSAKLCADHRRALRPVRLCAVPGRRGHAERDRIRPRHAQSRRRVHAHELRRQVPGRSDLHAGVRGAQPPPRRALHPSGEPSLLRAAGAGAARRRHRVRDQHDARHRQVRVLRLHRGNIPTCG